MEHVARCVRRESMRSCCCNLALPIPRSEASGMQAMVKQPFVVMNILKASGMGSRYSGGKSLPWYCAAG